MNKRILKIILLFSVFFQNSFAQVNFIRYDQEDGFTDNTFRSIIQDEKGYLWFGTLNGLNRFDGHDVKVYKYEEGNPTSLPYNKIFKIKTDNRSNIWIITYNSSVHWLNTKLDKIVSINNLIDEDDKVFSCISIVKGSENSMWGISRQNGAFRVIFEDEIDSFRIDFLNTSNVLPSNYVRFIHTDKNKSTWIGTKKGLVKIKHDTAAINSLSISTYFNQQNSADFNVIQELDNQLLFGTVNKGLLVYDFKTDTFISWNKYTFRSDVRGIQKGINNDILITTEREGFLYIDKDNELFLFPPGKRAGDSVRPNYYRIYCDRHGMFWLESDVRGVTMFDPSKKRISYFGLHPEIRESTGEADDPIFLEDSQGNLWIGIYGGGIARFDRDNQEFEQYFHNSDKSNSISSNLVVSMFEDNAKNIWIGTFQEGLNKLEQGKLSFTHILPVKNPLHQSFNEVRAIEDDSYNRIWVGTKEGHVYCYNQQLEKIFTIPEDLNVNTESIKKNVYELFNDEEGNLWVGTKGQGVFEIEGILAGKELKGEKYKIKNFIHDASQPDVNQLTNNDIYALAKDYAGQLWIGSFNGGLDLLTESGNNKFTNFSHNPDDSTSLSDQRIRYLMCDSKDNLWICTVNGLNLLQKKYLTSEHRVFVRFTGDDERPSSSNLFDIMCIHEDAKGRIWVGTYANGLKLLSYDTANFKYDIQSFDTKNGLPSEVIFSIESDEHGNLWLGTDKGLCKLNVEKGFVENFYKEEGVGHNIFSEGVGVVGDNGMVYFGLKQGFVSFAPDSIKKDTISYNVVLTRLKVLNEEIRPKEKGSPLKTTLDFTEEITLNHKENFFEIHYSILDYLKPERCQFKYILTGVDKDWVNAGSKRFATYTNLDPGKYVFKVQAANHDGHWSKDIATMKIIIVPPYYQTWWFRILAAILVIIISIGYYFRRIFVLKQQKRKLEAQVKKRTEEIEFKNKALTKQAKQLNEANEFLVERQQFIEEQAEELKSQAEKLSKNNKELNKLNATKDKFFSIIAHDLKNPFSVVIGFAELMVKRFDAMSDDKKRNLLKSIFVSAKNVNILLENLLNWSRSQTGAIKINRKNISIYDISISNENLISKLAEEKNIKIKNNIPKDAIAFADQNMINTVFRNLLANSVKFTDNGSIELSCETGKSQIQIYFKDAGVGISEDKIKTLFNIEKNLSTNGTKGESGTGLGLIICKEFIDRNQGSIEVKSTLGEGTTFIISLPAAKPKSGE